MIERGSAAADGLGGFSRIKYTISSGIFFLLTITLILASCASPEARRESVPVSMGIRMSPDIQPERIKEGMLASEGLGCRSVVVEFPLRLTTPENYTPLIDSRLISRFKETAKQLLDGGFTISLAIATTNVQEIFPYGAAPTVATWFPQLEMLTDSLVNAMAPGKPERILFGKNLIPVESETTHWATTLEKMKKKYGVPVSYAVDISRVDAVTSLLELSDEIAIAYAPQNGNSVIPYCREANHKASLVAEKLQKPVFIFQANLLGEHPEQLFDYRLRFWSEEVELNGIVINSLYPRFAVSDTFIYFGLKKHPACLELLEDYMK